MSQALFDCFNCCIPFCCLNVTLTFNALTPGWLRGEGWLFLIPNVPAQIFLESLQALCWRTASLWRREMHGLQLGQILPLLPRPPSSRQEIACCAPSTATSRYAVLLHYCMALPSPVAGRGGIFPLPGATGFASPARCLPGA